MKEKLEAKLKELQNGLAQAQSQVAQSAANVNAFNGAIQVVTQLLTDEAVAPDSAPVEQVN